MLDCENCVRLNCDNCRHAISRDIASQLIERDTEYQEFLEIAERGYYEYHNTYVS